MSGSCRVGLLPLYLKLYDDCLPGSRDGFTGFIEEVVRGLQSQQLDVSLAPICRLQEEVEAAIRLLSDASVDVIVTFHLAYSPSLEAAKPLAASRFPVILLDTTMDSEFGINASPDRILYNHGIHGVQDLANVLLRLGKPYSVAAGHTSGGRVFERAAALVRGAHAAALLRRQRLLRIGDSFAGMGDFAVSDDALQNLIAAKPSQVNAKALDAYLEEIGDDEIAEEIALDRDAFEVLASDEVHTRSVRAGLALRRCLDQDDISAFSMSFLAFDDSALDTVPFLEASKAMASGIGYAGEGDVLTAALVGALAQSMGQTTFTEMFCPDWAGNSVFLSHMGEVNPELAAKRPQLREKDMPWSTVKNPAVLTCALAPGPAVLVNLAPGPHDTFSLIAAPVAMLEEGETTELSDWIRGWYRPRLALPEFLEGYSTLGGTHHSALVMGDTLESIRAFAHHAGLPFHCIS